MISASSSSTLRTARKLVAEPLICLERHRTLVVSLNQQQRRDYYRERSTPENPPRQPQPVPTTTRLGTRKNRSFPNPQSKVGSSDDKPEREKRFLEPYTLSQRLIRLASQDRLDDAVNMLQNSPLDASNVTTWNTILLHCMMKERFKLGFKSFTDMKRRGFKPNSRTYNVLFSGLSRIEDWKEYNVQFKNAQTLWQGFLQHIERLKKIDPNHTGITPNPAAFYISILTANGEYNAAFDVLNDLDDEGPFSPTEFVYSKLFQGIYSRTQLVPGDQENVAYRNASDVKLLWKNLVKRATKNPELVSSHAITHSIRALAKGRPADQLYAFDLAREFLGLSKPGEEAPQRRLEVAPIALDSVLQLCITTQKYRLCVHYVQQLIDEAIANEAKCVVDTKHMDKVLQSYAAMTGAGSVGESDRAVETIKWMHLYHALGWNVKPGPNTYGWGLMSCWRGGDWASATRIAELMTGCHAEDFIDGSQNSSLPRLDDRTKNKRAVPDVRDMSCLLRAALASGELANMRQCLRMAAFFGDLRSTGQIKSIDLYLALDDLANTPAAKRENSFYSMKVVSTMADILKLVLDGTKPEADTPEMKTWRELRTKTKKILQESTKPAGGTPYHEHQPLGSATSLEATGRFVDYDMATRSQKPGKVTR